MPIWPQNDGNNHVAWHEGANALLFGRWGGTDCVIEHPSCSRQHAWLGWDAEGTLTLEDLGSAAGTRVNGERAPGGTQVALAPGATVIFGESTRSYIVRERRQAVAPQQGEPAPAHEVRAVRAEIDALKAQLEADGSGEGGGGGEEEGERHGEASSSSKKRKKEKKEKKEKKHKKHKKHNKENTCTKDQRSID